MCFSPIVFVEKSNMQTPATNLIPSSVIVIRPSRKGTENEICERLAIIDF